MVDVAKVNQLLLFTDDLSRAFPFVGDRSASVPRWAPLRAPTSMTSQTACSMYSLICCSVMSMSSGASSATRQLRHFSGSESLWQKIVHHVTTLPSSCSRLLQSTLMQRHSLTLLLYTASCALRMRLNACFTSLFIALSVLWWAALGSPTC